MDAKERLRQYLEQRRDLGESELVLDSLSVEDVMKLLGAASAVGRSARGDAPVKNMPLSAERQLADAPPLERSDHSASSSDWREALRAADVPSNAPSRPIVPPPPLRNSALRSDAERAPSPPPSPSRETAQPSDSPVDSEILDEESSNDAPTPRDSDRGDDSPQPNDMSPRAGGGKKAGDAAPKKSTPSASNTAAEAPSSQAKIPLSEIPTGLVVGTAAHELFNGEGDPFKSLVEIADAVQGCRRCRLYSTAKQGVPGEGDAKADLVCVGEAPGANEDETGRPFVGQAGQLLTKILAAIDLAREDVFIVNVLKHRPPGNRNPMPDEVAACSPYLVRQIELIDPKVIVAFGTFAAQTLLQTKEPIGKLRGRIHRYHGVPLIVTYHPAALLRNPAWKRPTWEDVQLARRLLDRARDA
ncbi:MAG: uracil-DNA glycosylase [Gemmatimonadaceae bacterium]